MTYNKTSTIFKSLKEKPLVESHSERRKSGKGFISKLKKKNKKRRNRRLRVQKKKFPKSWKYKEYIRSPAWKERRKQFFGKYGKRCVICRGDRNIGLHHISYENLGSEPDEDLVALCWQHHGQYHEQHGTKRRMKEETYKFITEEQESIELADIVRNL